VLLALIFLVSAALGAYHAGVEWGFWEGPADCAGAPAPGPSGMGDFLKQLETVRVVSCTEAAFRFLGLSMAGWNAVVSLGLVGVAAVGALSLRTR
jgi:disulfide bond formation protein DsbB